MDDAKTKFCRNAPAIAKAFGIRLFRQRHRKHAQLSEIRKWMAETTFPKKHKHGWQTTELIAWKSARNGKNGHPVDGLFADDAKIKAMRKNAIRQAYAEAQPPSFFRKFDLKELVAAELPKELIDKIFGQTQVDSDELPGGQEGIAEFFRREFNYPCHKMDISRWMRGQNLPAGCTEPLPAGHLSGRHKKSILRVWASKNLPRTQPNGELQLGGDIRSQSEKLSFQRQQDEYALWKQEKSKLYMLVSDHDSALRSAGTIIWPRITSILEQQLIQGLEAQLKAMPDDAKVGKSVQAIVAEARARHQKAVDDLQREMAGQLGE